MNITAVAPNTVPNTAPIQLAKQPGNMQAFGQVFGQMLINPVSEAPTVQASGIEELLAILNLSSLEDLEEMVKEPVNKDELQNLLSDLIGNEPVEDKTNLWDFLEGMLVQSPIIKEAILNSVQPGQSGQPKKESAIQLVEQLKKVELFGKNADLTLKQESVLFDISQLLGAIKESVSSMGKTEGSPAFQVIKTMHTNLHLTKIISQPVTTDPVVEEKEITVNQGQLANLTQPKIENGTITLPVSKPAQSEEMVKELQKLMDRVQFGQTGGANRLVIKLYPEQLGTVRIELIQKDGMLTAKMLASTALGKELLDTNSSQLRNSLLGQNIQVEKLEITMALQEPARHDRQQGFEGSFKQQQQSQDQGKQKQDNQEDVHISFQELLNGMEG